MKNSDIEHERFSKSLRREIRLLGDGLLEGRASVMIGAGFSLNARGEYPTWCQLGKIFRDHLGDAFDVEEKGDDPIHLASLVEAQDDRRQLAKLICDSIKDEPQDADSLHVQLLKLPWRNVYTTNYDCLLEKAIEQEQSLAEKYTIIKKQEQIVGACQHPRLIKLHGSIDTHEFVATEKDYLDYPRNKAIFVNTVVQSLVENSFCLVGFSGEDPNFKQWLTWVRRELKEHSYKCYLVSVDKISSGQRNYFKKEYNIEVLDLSEISLEKRYENIEPKDGDVQSPRHQEEPEEFARISILLDELRAYTEQRRSDNVSSKELSPNWPAEKIADVDDIAGLTLSLAAQRAAYPGWIVPPRKTRKKIWRQLQAQDFFNDYFGVFAKKKSQRVPPYDLELLYELNWLLEKSLFPIPNDIVPSYMDILSQYDPFECTVTSLSGEKKTIPSEKWGVLQVYWIDLNISLLRYLREEGLDEEWRKYDKRLRVHHDKFSPEQCSRYAWECCWKRFFDMDLDGFISEITNWKPDASLPLWTAKRAALLAEIGRHSKGESGKQVTRQCLEDARKIIETALKKIKKQQQPGKTDYKLLSSESIILKLLFCVDGIFSWSMRMMGRETVQKLDQSDYQKQVSRLEGYHCNPDDDLSYFHEVLKQPLDNRKEFDRYGFEVGKVTTSYRVGSVGQSEQAYCFLRFCEETGIPFVLPSINVSADQAWLATKRISWNNFIWSMANALRLGHGRQVGDWLHRGLLSEIKSDDIDEAIAKLIDIYHSAKNYDQQTSRMQLYTLHIQIQKVVPEILSRLVTKWSTKTIDSLFEFFLEVCQPPFLDYSKEAESFITLFMKTVPQDQLEKFIIPLLKLPIIESDNFVVQNSHVEPFSRLRNISVSPETKKEIRRGNSEFVPTLVNALKSDNNDTRTRSLFRFNFLINNNCLNVKFAPEFKKALYLHRDELGFPINSQFYRWYFLTLKDFIPIGENLTEQFKNYALQFDVDIDEGEGITLANGQIQVLDEIINATLGIRSKNSQTWQMEWSESDACHLLNASIEWWNNNKEKLERHGRHGEFHKRFLNLGQLLSLVVIPNLSIRDNEAKGKLQNLLEQLDKNSIPVLDAHLAASLHFFPQYKDEIIGRIEDKLVKYSEDDYIDPYHAITWLLRSKKYNGDPCTDGFLETVSQQIKWRHEPALVNAINTFQYALNVTPEKMTDALCANILAGMLPIVEETIINSQDSEERISSKLSVRKSAARLARLMHHYLTDKSEDIPPVLETWRGLCENSEEFGDIRVQWSDAV